MISCEPLPPGFRFHPTDEELIIHYLQNQATSRPCPVPIIPELNIYKFDPWELPGKSDICEGEWYFFSPRDRKYPNGSRPNRGTKSGYWKATGTDKAIRSGPRSVGIKKALVFYEGRPPRGSKTDWIMHEYRLSGAAAAAAGGGRSCSTSGRTMRLDDWVLCRIYHKGISNQKKCSTSAIEQDTSGEEYNNNNNNYYYNYSSSAPASEELQSSEPEEEEKPTLTPTLTPTPLLPRSCSMAHLLEGHHDYISVSQLFDDAPYCSIDDLFNSGSGGGSRGDASSAADFHAGRSQSAVIGRSVFC